MIQGVESLEAELELHPLGGTKVLVESQIQFVHMASADVAPAGWIVANVGREILVDNVLDAIARRRNVAVAGDGSVLRREGEKLVGIEPMIQRLFVVGQRKIFSREKRVVAEDYPERRTELCTGRLAPTRPPQRSRV